MRTIFLVAAATVTLAGCSDAKKASKPNFEKAINTFFATVPVCLDAPKGEFLPANVPDRDKAPPFPAFARVPEGLPFERQFAQTAAKPFDALVSAGLLRRSGPKPLLGHDYTNSDVSTRQVYEYDLTSAGKSAFGEHDTKGFFGIRHQSFCYGTPEVIEITRYTEPGNAGGQMISQVNYTFHLKDQAAWAKNPAMVAAFPSLAGTTDDKIEGSTVVILTNEGWADSRLKS